MPQDLPGELRNHKKSKSAFSNFFNRISKRVLKPRNHDSADTDDGSDKGSIKASTAGRTPAKPAKARSSTSSVDKENLPMKPPDDVNPFDRNKKNPLRLSNRFKSKILK